jgi:hypothetical protein
MSDQITAAELERWLTDTLAHAARVEFCEQTSNAVDSCGKVLWAFGCAVEVPDREGLALVCQAAGELSTATVDLYRAEHWYAGAVLLRQFIECEYLVYLFALDCSHSAKWRKSTREERLDFFRPAAMRKLTQGKFRSEEYAIHCERGGHPSPFGSSLLPEHTASLLGKNRYLWSDLAQHLERFWGSFELAVDALDLGHIGIIQSALRDFPGWKDRDLLASWISLKPEGEVTGDHR